jgi:hypothetical protein
MQYTIRVEIERTQTVWNLTLQEGNMRELTWRQLCQEIMDEQDPVKLFALADALSRALDEPQVRLNDPETPTATISAVC